MGLHQTLINRLPLDFLISLAISPLTLAQLSLCGARREKGLFTLTIIQIQT